MQSSSKITLGVSLVLLGLLLLVPRGVSDKSSSFENEPVKTEGFSISDNQENSAKRVIVPELKIDLEVRQSMVVNGYWEVFDNAAGWGQGSGIPGEKGNQVIFAHAREGLFLPLQSIKPETNIYIITENNWYNYKVKEIKEVYPNRIEVISPTEDETLTLYTCSGYKDSKRLIITAKREII